MHENPLIHYNPFLYEINTRVWIKQFSNNGIARLDEVPLSYWKTLKSKGFDYVWLMGVWKVNLDAIEKYCFEEGLVKEYEEALDDYTIDDVIGSAFSIEDYIVNPDVGGEEALMKLKEKLNAIGLKLVLDFIPNHFSAESELIKTTPELFLQGNEELMQLDPGSFFVSNGKIFAHGKDPFFPAWKDSVQVNYFNERAREFMINRLERVAGMCDGVRCDMAMLVNNNVFKKTWESVIEKTNLEIPQVEFWEDAVSRIKSNQKDFTFIAEVYWDKEYKLQQFGFDFTYDKTFLERIIAQDVDEIKSHLLADDGFQRQSVRFLENHDEQRILKVLGAEKVKAAAVTLTTVQGMKLIYDGQTSGKLKRLPVQLGRESFEHVNKELENFYERLFEITSRDIFRRGMWEPVDPEQVWEDNYSNENILAWVWIYGTQRILVVINYSDEPSQCNLKIDTKNIADEFQLKDILNDVLYTRSAKEIRNIGLYIDLEPYQSHIFSY